MSVGNTDANPNYKKRTYFEDIRKSELPLGLIYMCGSPRQQEGLLGLWKNSNLFFGK